MKLEAPMKISSGVRNITQVESETLPFFFGRVLGGRLARGKLRKNYKCLKTTKSLVVVSREIHLGLVFFRPSVGGRLARRLPGTCDFSAKCWWSSGATFTWDL